MTPEQLLHVVRELHALGAVHVKVDGLEAVFPARAAEQPAQPAYSRQLSELEQHVHAALGSA